MEHQFEGEHLGRRFIVFCRLLDHPGITPGKQPCVVRYQVESNYGTWLPAMSVTDEGAKSLDHGKELGFKYAKRLIEDG